MRAESFLIYGSPKITVMFVLISLVVSQKAVTDYMQEVNLNTRYVCKPNYKLALESFDKKLNNVRCRELNPSSLKEIRYTVTTYILPTDGFVYLASILDPFSQ